MHVALSDAAVRRRSGPTRLSARRLQGPQEGIGRLLLIETSTTAAYDPTRGFYLARGYDQVAVIPHFYADDDGKAIFAKRRPS